MRTFETVEGWTIEAQWRGIRIDLHVRNAAGRTVATVELNEDDAAALVADLKEI